MRLAQLARQVGEKTFTIRESLSEKFDIDFEKGPNTKLEAEHVAYIEERFKKEEPVVKEPIIEKMVPVAVDSATEPEKAEVEPTPSEVKPATPSPIESVEEVQENPVKEDPTPAIEKQEDLSKRTVAQLKEIARSNGIKGISAMKKAELIQVIEGSQVSVKEKQKEVPEKIDLAKADPSKTPTKIEDILGRPEPEFPDLPKPEEAELIKAPKVQLEGIKVVDKIDLPEPPKPKEKKESEEDESKTQKRRQDQKTRSKRPQHKDHHGQGNQNRQKKKQPQVKKAPTKQELQKQKFEESYKPKPKQVKGKKKKAAKKKTAPPKAPEIQPEEIKNPKKSALGKFWWWLTNG